MNLVTASMAWNITNTIDEKSWKEVQRFAENAENSPFIFQMLVLVLVELLFRWFLYVMFAINMNVQHHKIMVSFTSKQKISTKRRKVCLRRWRNWKRRRCKQRPLCRNSQVKASTFFAYDICDAYVDPTRKVEEVSALFQNVLNLCPDF